MRKLQNSRAKTKLKGGNRRPQTFKNCGQCGIEFGPLKYLKQKYCSKKCGYENLKSRPKKPKVKVSKKVRYAQRRVSYLISIGNMVRPSKCVLCLIDGFIEAAHYNYDEPERVKWLCRSCHRKWDKQEPKMSKEAKLHGKTED